MPTTGLLIPDDASPNTLQIRRLLLNFGSLLVIDPSDRYLHHEGEVHDEGGYHIKSGRFPNRGYISSTWPNKVRIPRSEDHKDKLYELVQSDPALLEKSIVNLVHARKNARVNHFLNWHQTRAMAANRDVVETAVSDGTSEEETVTDLIGEADWHIGPVIDQYSRFWTPNRQTAQPRLVHPRWVHIAEGRIARFIKAQQLAFASGAVPVAISEINTGIANQQHALYAEKVPMDARGISLEFSVFDEENLCDLLNDCSWKEYYKIREKVLPLVSKLKARTLSAAKSHLDTKSRRFDVLNEVGTIQTEVDLLREEYADKLERLRIGSIINLGRAAGGGTLFSSLPAIPITVSGYITTIASASLVAMAAVKDELADYAPARRRLIGHPLYQLQKILKPK